MRVLLFTCGRDKEKARLASLTIPKEWSLAWVVDSCDAEIDAPKGVDVLVKPFPRGRNLFGVKAVLGISEILAQEAEEHGRVVKMDSDCLLIAPSFLTRGDLSGMAHERVVGAAYGLAYALSIKAACGAYQTLLRGIALGVQAESEDVSITAAASCQGIDDGRMPVGAFWETKHDGKSCPAGRVAIHCGAVNYASRDGDAVAKEMKRLGDELNIWRRA